ncbi:hypothetical protein M422DRAFT_259426 [Sphaerobolus stellatus SS14]|uniref:Unplaced genomic scaffold SPHSTscaffold_89, whole genome shotgun sequence n=1 Tax=Sphaerobolus stellatus (strain SS14) TaxID=990650 RepID=A0A0C9VK06_SPHS4|nr:hypothetical protein M422DRAFT_259426 [Sphaerobolus stellatus SS14]
MIFFQHEGLQRACKELDACLIIKDVRVKDSEKIARKLTNPRTVYDENRLSACVSIPAAGFYISEGSRQSTFNRKCNLDPRLTSSTGVPSVLLQLARSASPIRAQCRGNVPAYQAGLRGPRNARQHPRGRKASSTTTRRSHSHLVLPQFGLVPGTELGPNGS